MGSSVLKTPDISCVREYLTTEPDIVNSGDGTRAYEEAIVRLIDKNPWTYDNVRTIMRSLMNENEAHPDLAYAAFYALCTYYRRHSHKAEYNELLNDAKPEFREKISYAFLRLMCRKMIDPHDWTILEEADRLSDPQVMGYNYGVEHCFAEYVAAACEKEPAHAKYFVTEYLEDAITRVNDAIKQSAGYPKFYVTRARLQNIKAIYADVEDRDAYFKQSQNDIEIAISKETDKAKQIDYQLIGIKMQSDYYESILNVTIKMQETAMNEKMQESNVKSLEFLSFFSAIIGLLIAGTQIMLGMTFAAGATLLVALTGCLITAFGTIGFVLNGKGRSVWANIIIVVIGIVLTVIALLYGAHYAM